MKKILYILLVVLSLADARAQGNMRYVRAVGPVVTRRAVVAGDAPAAITGELTMCKRRGMTALYNATPGGTWSSDNALVVIGSTGLCQSQGTATGTANITYTTSGGTATVQVTVNSGAGNNAQLGAVTPICVAGTEVIAGTGMPDCTWTSSNEGVATVIAGPAASTTATGVALGTTLIEALGSLGCRYMAYLEVNCP